MKELTLEINILDVGNVEKHPQIPGALKPMKELIQEVIPTDNMGKAF
jgi:hypothetical protein